MKISEVLEKLQEIQNREGDIEVRLLDEGGVDPVIEPDFGVETLLYEGNKRVAVIF